MTSTDALRSAALTVAVIATATVLGAAGFAQVPSQVDGPEQVSIELDPGSPVASYSIETIKDAFPVHDRLTRTPWTKGNEVIHYRGVLLEDILAKHGLDSYERVEIRADDGFLSVINKEDIESYAPMVAFERECTDGDRQASACSGEGGFRSLTIDESGPFFMVWPYDKLPEGYVPARNNLWVWWVITIRAVR